MQIIFKEIVAFKKNLDLQLEDIALENNGISIELYFDTSDIYETLQGLEAFYTPAEGFDLNKFKDKRALVHSLAASGWLGEYQLVPPHLGELIILLKSNRRLDIDIDPKRRARKFLKDIGITDNDEFKDVYFEGLSKEQFYNFIKRQAGRADSLFKACQCIVPFHKRVEELPKQKILKLSAPKLQYDRLAQSEYLHGLCRQFNLRRPDTPQNNILDALVITFLIDMVSNYEAGASKIIPRFLVPSPLFQEVIDAAGVAPLLSYQSPTGTVSSVLRDSDYYIFKAYFRQQERFTAVEDERRDRVSREYLRVHEKVAAIVESGEALKDEALEELDFHGTPLIEVIKDFQMITFLEDVWLKYEAPEEMIHTLSDVAQAAQEMSHSATFQQRVKEAIEELQSKIGESVSEFKWISDVWTKLEKSAETLRLRADLDSFNSPNFFRGLGLFRYGFPQSTHQNIRNILQELLRGEMAEKDARLSVMNACYQGRKNPKKNVNSLVIGAAILRVAEMDNELYSLLNKTKPLPNFSLKILLAELLFKFNLKSERGAKLLNQLEKQYKDLPPTSRKRGDLAVGIAYLFVRLWRARGGYATWRQHPDTYLHNQDELRQLYIDKAVTYAQEAYGLLEDNPMKKVYALNQYLYYLVQGGSDDQQQERDEAAQNLSDYKMNQEIWQYRFDDTLARYLFRLATAAKDKDKWTELMREAKWHADKARKKSHGDPDVEELYTSLTIRIAAGYEGQRKNQRLEAISELSSPPSELSSPPSE
jgi:hypothetical protein